MISASVGVNSSLLLEPSQTLPFALDFATATTRGARACLTLTNISPRKLVAFKVRTTNVDMFMVKPAQGVIEPSTEIPVVITLLPPACERILKMKPDDRAALVERFLIQSIDRSDDMRGFSVDDLTAFWRRLPKELITNKKLTCRFLEAREGDPTMHVPLHRMRLASDEPMPDVHLPGQQVQGHRQPPPAPVIIPPTPVDVENMTSPEPHPARGPLGKPGQKPQPRKLSTAPTSANSPPEAKASPVKSANVNAVTPPPAPRPPVAANAKASPPKRLSQSGRSAPSAMNMPSSPVPSLRPKSVFPPEHQESGNVNGNSSDSQDEQDLSNGSNDSYATERVPKLVFEELIPSDDTLEYRLHPSESLLFPVHHAYPDDSPLGIVEGKSYFFITNKARQSGLAFKIKTSNHAGYFVKPARGFIDAKSAVRVDVFVNAPDATRFNGRDREMKDRFLVELLFVGPAKSADLLSLPEDRRRQDLQRVWDESKAADGRQAVLTCQILEEDSPIDPTHQTAEQARALLQKSQAAGTLSFNNHHPLPLDSTGESANAYVHPPVSPAMQMPRGPPYPSQQYPQSPQPYQYGGAQVRSPVMFQSKSPVKQAPQARSPVAPPQGRSPVRQQYYGNDGMPPRGQQSAYDDHRTYYA